MRSLMLFVTLALMAPHADAGDFIPRQQKEPVTAPPTAKPSPRRAKPVRKITRTASKPKKKSKHREEWKRPMP